MRVVTDETLVESATMAVIVIIAVATAVVVAEAARGLRRGGGDHTTVAVRVQQRHAWLPATVHAAAMVYEVLLRGTVLPRRRVRVRVLSDGSGEG